MIGNWLELSAPARDLMGDLDTLLAHDRAPHSPEVAALIQRHRARVGGVVICELANAYIHVGCMQQSMSDEILDDAPRGKALWNRAQFNFVVAGALYGRPAKEEK